MRLPGSKVLNYYYKSTTQKVPRGTPVRSERSSNVGYSNNIFKQPINWMRNISVGDLVSGKTSRVLFTSEVEPQVHSLLQWLNPPERPMRHHRGSANLVVFLQQIYLP